jgi:hypothetical protein
MTDTDKIIAAIFTTGLCMNKAMAQAGYLETYNTFLDLMEKDQKAKKKPPMEISQAMLEQVRAAKKSRT